MEENRRGIYVFDESSVDRDTSGVVVWCIRWSGMLEIVVGRIDNDPVKTALLEKKGMKCSLGHRKVNRDRGFDVGKTEMSRRTKE